MKYQSPNTVPKRQDIFTCHNHKLFTMNNDEYVTYDESNHVLICRQHGYGIPLNWIKVHFQRLHKETPLQKRNEIIEFAKSLDLWAPEEVLASHDGLFVNGLTTKEGYQCQYEACQELYGSESSMWKHSHKVHRWTTVQGIQWTKQALQTIFQGPHLR